MNKKMAMGWLPYPYAKQGPAGDFWPILKKEWVDTGEFRT